MIFVYVFKDKMNNDEKIEECKISFHNYHTYILIFHTFSRKKSTENLKRVT